MNLHEARRLADCLTAAGLHALDCDFRLRFFRAADGHLCRDGQIAAFILMNGHCYEDDEANLLEWAESQLRGTQNRQAHMAAVAQGKEA